MNNIIKDKFQKRIEEWRTRGAIAPSSPFLVNKMLSKIDFDSELHLLQLGYGNGVFTKALLKKMSASSTLTIFEINPECRQYMINDPRVIYIYDSAEYIQDYCGAKRFDHIISTLPFGSLSRDVSERIFDQMKNHLKCGGKFLQYQYSLLSKKDISQLFEQKPKIDFTLLNLPPAFIYEIIQHAV